MISISPELKWIWSYLKRYKMMTTITIFGSIIEIILFSLPTIYVAIIIELYVTQASLAEIVNWLIIILGTAVIQASIFFLVASVNEVLAHRVTTDMTSDLFNVLQNRPLYYHDQIRIGDVMARATGDTRVINIGLSPAFRILGQIITALIFSFLVFVTISLEMSAILFFLSPIYAYAIYRYAKKIEPLSKEVQDIFGDLSIQTSESLIGIRELKSYTSEDHAEKNFNEYSQLHATKVKKMGIVAALYYPALIMALALGLTTIIGIFFITQGKLKVSELVAFVGLISLLIWIGRNLQWVTEYAARTNASARRIREMLFREDIPQLPEGFIDFKGDDTTIVFENVSFHYNANNLNSKNPKWILNNISIKINHGETIAIVGGPGSGKSTFNKLILRLYDPNKGCIYLAGEKLSNFSNSSLRHKISSIEQEIFLFSETIERNIAFGNPQVSHEQIVEVAKQASAHDFISSELDNGYDTIIGERGVRLSGGQKQRIAIARALLINPSILIMDDASSALDAETEAEIQQAIRNVLKTRTSIVTTHRLSIITEADRVLVFDKGRIVADGPHDQLIRTSQYYRRLFENHYKLPPLEVDLKKERVK